jgi:hypothetical protein
MDWHDILSAMVLIVVSAALVFVGACVVLLFVYGPA